jgi:hypothetical protein
MLCPCTQPRGRAAAQPHTAHTHTHTTHAAHASHAQSERALGLPNLSVSTVTRLTVPHCAKCACSSSGVTAKSTCPTNMERASTSSLLAASAAASSSAPPSAALAPPPCARLGGGAGGGGCGSCVCGCALLRSPRAGAPCHHERPQRPAECRACSCKPCVERSQAATHAPASCHQLLQGRRPSHARARTHLVRPQLVCFLFQFLELLLHDCKLLRGCMCVCACVCMCAHVCERTRTHRQRPSANAYTDSVQGPRPRQQQLRSARAALAAR